MDSPLIFSIFLVIENKDLLLPDPFFKFTSMRCFISFIVFIKHGFMGPEDRHGL